MTSKLKAVRSGHKSAIAKLITKFQQRSSDRENLDDVRQIQKSLTQKLENLRETNQKIIDAMPDDSEMIEQDIVEQDEYIFNVETVLSSVDKLIQANATYEENQHLRNTSNSAITSQSYHKLPKLYLPTFSGDMLQWQTFWESFQTSVHENPALTDNQKFSYLKAQVTHEASDCIAGLALTSANYNQAISLLRERYGQTHKIVNANMQALLDLPTPTNHLASLKMFYDKLEAYIRGLESLGQHQDSYAQLLIPIIMGKLPSAVKVNITRENGGDRWTLCSLRKTLLKEITIQECIGAPSIHFSQSQENNVIQTASFVVSKGKRNGANKSSNRLERAPREQKNCVFCDGAHSPNNCDRVTNLSDRIDIVKRKKLCFNCLGTHRVKDCISQCTCRICGKKHHTSICSASPGNVQTQSDGNMTYVKSSESTLPVESSEGYSETSIFHTSAINTEADILLKTAVSPVWSESQRVYTNILLDEGSQRSFITENLAHELQVKYVGRTAIRIAGFGDSDKHVQHLNKAVIYLETQRGDKIPLEVLVVPNIAAPLQNQSRLDINNLPYLTGLTLAHPVSSNDMFEVSLLIGADYYWSIVQNKVIRGNGPTAVESKLGYLVSGPLKSTGSSDMHTSVLNVIIPHRAEECDLEKFWKLESLGISHEKEPEEKSNLVEYQTTCIKYEENHYIAKLPWKADAQPLPSNYSVTKRRTESVIKRLAKEPEMLNIYRDIIRDQEERGFIEKVPQKEISEDRVHYIPHHPVKKDSATTPIRIVFDCSCRQTNSDPSLNDCLSSMPPILNSLPGILARFRLNKYAVSTDIEKAFLQIGLDKQDRDFTRFLWLSNPDDPTSPLETYRFKVVLFGATCSPFILNATLLKHLQENASDTTRKIVEDLYVDNILTSVEDENSLATFYTESRKLLHNGGFNLRSWSSNSDVLRQMAERDNIWDRDSLIKLLGMRWDVDSDKLLFQKHCVAETPHNNVTKREILRQSSKIFDPLGLISPVTVKAKLLMQTLWTRSFTWDEILPMEIQTQWENIGNDINKVIKKEIPRYYFRDSGSTDEKSLHIFTDASTKAYGACAYIISGSTSTLVMAKNRVSPLKHTTLPRLELMAAVIGAKLMKYLTEQFNAATWNVTFWSDSQIVLSWLSSKKTHKPFIQNRVKEILSLTNSYKWNYCPTEQNPADLLTRGVNAEQCLNSELWWNGPSWITDSSQWPSWDYKTTHTLSNIIDSELLHALPVNDDIRINEKDTVNLHTVIDIKRYSSYPKLIRVTAYVRRFIHNCRCHQDNKVIGTLAVSELESARLVILKSEQSDHYGRDLYSLQTGGSQTCLTRQLRLFIDNDGLIRCGGRIHNASLKRDTKFPYLLPAKSYVTELIVKHCHKRMLHSGVNATVTDVRQHFWIPSIRQVVRKILRKCITCQKVNSKPYAAPDPPPLPACRLQDSYPFKVTGVDFTGELHVKGTNNSNYSKKVYICLFTCASSRAIHLEIVPSLTVQSFLLAFKRFVSRKAIPQLLMSDNAMAFIAASSRLQESLHSKGITWKFIPKRAPWFGGFWERLIGLTKTSLKKVLGRCFLTEEELTTVLAEVEAVINDRPITYVPSDNSDDEPLTPSHLLYGRRVTSTSIGTHTNDPAALNKQMYFDQFKDMTGRLNHFWSRWRHEYLTSLREYHRVSGNNNQTIKTGDVVHIYDDFTPRVRWNVALMEELIRGRDGLVRSAIVRTKTGLTNRPITKLFPLELQ